MHESVYSEITGKMIREAALRTKGARGPSGVDANGFKRLLACKYFKKSSANLSDAMAATTRRLCTEYVDPLTIEQLLANRQRRGTGSSNWFWQSEKKNSGQVCYEGDKRRCSRSQLDFLKVLRTIAISGLVLPVRRTFHSCCAPNLREDFFSWGVIHILLCVVQ